MPAELSVPEGLDAGPDGLLRCAWSASAPDYRDYHDTEWGRPLHGDQALFERISLEAFQSGLSWLTILRKRPGFRQAFHDFDPTRVAMFGADEVSRLMTDASIVRNRRKIEATIVNARAVLVLQEAGESLDAVVWRYADDSSRRLADPADIPTMTDASRALSRELKARGFVFVGPTTMYAAMQACGLVDDHLAGCHVVSGHP
jgi:DNA-3-methyladenine glycosylase I